ncbi:hypothetical protein JCM10908_000589 [Rhodotorula pacifica]|uniref:uncharacterized protein n=1 Tax=Rhodotorula pacifica TaxID=1495444 RepID=UPI00318297B2
MPPRFFSSPYKNAVATPAKREGWWSEIPVATSAPSDAADAIKATSDYWLALGSASGSLVVLPYDHQGKQGSKAPSLQTGIRTITAFETDGFDDLLAVGGENGQINVFALPESSSFDPAAPSAYSPTSTLSVTVPTGKAIDLLAFHPLASSLFLASSQSTISVFDAASQSRDAVYALSSPSQSWSAQWSSDGRSITATGKDGKLRLWDVRSNDPSPVIEVASHAGIKASRHVHLAAQSASSVPQIFTTGFSRTRDREYAVHDFRNLGNNGAVKTQRVDTGTGVLVPLLDESRGIVYLAGKGDMTLRWTEIGGPGGFTEGAAPLPVPIISAALAPPSTLDLMKAEINRLVILAGGGADAVLPVLISVPRRQYLDFHADLYPPVSARTPAQTSADWLGGSDDALLETYRPDPQTPRPARRARSTTSAKPSTQSQTAQSPATTEAASAGEQAAVAPLVPVVSAAPQTTGSEPSQSAPISTPSASSSSTVSANGASPAQRDVLRVDPPTEGLSKLDVRSPAAPSPVPEPKGATPPAKPANANPAGPSESTSKPPTKFASTPGQPYNPNWSRNFLAGKTPLKPDYFDVHDVSSTMGNDVQLLQANPTYIFYPLGGPGGRLAFHPLSRKGRLPVHASCVAIGGTITQFETDPFEATRVFVAGDDGSIRVFALPAEAPEDGATITEPLRILSDSKMDRVIELKHHPVAKDLLLSLSDDRGNPTGRLWNVASGDLLLQFELPKGGVSSAAWSPDGSLLALATKNKQVHIFDPRNLSATIRSSPSHESIRPVRLAWAAERRLLSTGFTRSASRELLLFAVEDTKLTQVGKTSLDISPAALFPFVDLDTRIALLYSRGDRSCLAFELDLDPKSPQQAFTKLPSFEHGSLQVGFAFLPKAHNDVKVVEIVRALRLTQKEVEVVSFTVPRAKVDFFQNDIFVPTRNVEKPMLGAAEWVEGKDATLELLDLRPDGMKLLSEAPAPVKTVSTRSKIKQDGMTDSQREQAHLDELFDNAKAGAASDEEEEEPVRSKNAIVDDDDW